MRSTSNQVGLVTVGGASWMFISITSEYRQFGSRICRNYRSKMVPYGKRLGRDAVVTSFEM